MNFFLIFFLAFVLIDNIIINNILGHKIKNLYNKFKNLPFLTQIIIFSIISFGVYSLFNITIVDYSLHFNGEIFMSDNNNKPVVDLSGSNTVNINTPQINISIDNKTANRIIAVGTSALSAGTAFRAMRTVGGSPAIKAATGVAAYGITAVGANIIAKQLNKNDKDYKKNLIENLDETNLNYSLEEYPLNLLFDLNNLISLEFLCLSILVNIFIVDYISKLDFIKFIPNNKFGEIIKKIIKNYINI